MNGRLPSNRASGGWSGGLTGPVPTDLWVLLGIVFGTFSLQFFSAIAWLPRALRLTDAVWQRGFLWQLLTYPFIGTGRPGIWLVIGLVILFLFGRDVRLRLGRRGFWLLLVQAAAVSGVVAVLTRLAGYWLVGPSPAPHFALMQGQHMLLTVLIAAFAVLNRNATIYLFFVLPVEARWFLLLEIVFAFLGYLGTGDLVGFVGLVVGVVASVGLLRPDDLRRGPRRMALRLRELWLKARLARLKRRRGMRVIRGEGLGEGGDKEGDPWIH